MFCFLVTWTHIFSSMKLNDNSQHLSACSVRQTLKKEQKDLCMCSGCGLQARPLAVVVRGCSGGGALSHRTGSPCQAQAPRCLRLAVGLAVSAVQEMSCPWHVGSSWARIKPASPVIGQVDSCTAWSHQGSQARHLYAET